MPLRFTSTMAHLLLLAMVAIVEGNMPIFVPLSCNADLSVTNCSSDNPLSSFISPNNETKIPCGLCATVDTTDGSTLSFPNGLNVEGMLYLPSTSDVVIETSHIFVQGVFKIDPPEINNTVRIHMIGTVEEYLLPHPENSMQCGSNGCSVGKKAIVVAGGTLDIDGVSDSDCPAWAALESMPDPNTLTVGSKAAACWGARDGDEILVTNSEIPRGWNKHFVSTVDSFDVAAGTVTITNSINSSPTTIEIDPEMAAEVAWLTRRVIFDADLDGTSNLHGGHLIILHTPNVAQKLEGVEIRDFGQQGFLGRYPIHFHMSDNVKGSIIRKNVIRSSKQRCIVIHGTDEVQIEDNVSYDTIGHCFVLEDGAEMENTFRGNLGAKITRPRFGIGASDNQPSIFWITNTKNHFIGNVAAGSLHAGFWFELQNTVRGPSQYLEKNKGIRPKYLPLYTFVNNTGHSCGNTGLRTYGPGWFGSHEKTFDGIKLYRNNWGLFLHGTNNLRLQNALFADNNFGIVTYGNIGNRNYLANSKIVGIPERYRETRCPAKMTGIQFGLEGKTQIQITDTSFSGFGNMPDGCTTSGIALKQGANSNNIRPLHDMPIVSNLSFDTNAVHAFDMENHIKLYDRNVFFEDPDGGMNPSSNPGFYINGKSKHMTAFLEKGACYAFPETDSYAHFCEKVCLRQLVVRTPCCTSSPPKFDYKMVVRSNDDPTKMFVFGKDVQFTRTYTFEIVLPAGNYNIDFVDPENGNILIPGEKDITYFLETAPHCTDHIESDSITFNYKLTTAPTKTKTPTLAPTVEGTSTNNPSFSLSEVPSTVNSGLPSTSSSELKSTSPSKTSSLSPSTLQSLAPSALSEVPSTIKSGLPSTSSSELKSTSPSKASSLSPSTSQSLTPSNSPSSAHSSPSVLPSSFPSLKYPCMNLKRGKCKKKCVFTKKPKKVKVCVVKTKFEQDCAQFTLRTPCLEVEVCKFANGRCFHSCDDLKKAKCIKSQLCKFYKIKNPCLGCQPVATCGSLS